ncbi:hypothetical protein AVEN_183005-1 [Araneus ventricosus]|uniref:Uncharacterized protein n=1 Tax=Araneus ventricosus TaxID=182803 RepID=A0A4Y2RCX9_ARAVE|nr:hypothetical protein AVEN_183005-1 [Araneus ventricosus]
MVALKILISWVRKHGNHKMQHMGYKEMIPHNGWSYLTIKVINICTTVLEHITPLCDSLTRYCISSYTSYTLPGGSVWQPLEPLTLSLHFTSHLVMRRQMEKLYSFIQDANDLREHYWSTYLCQCLCITWMSELFVQNYDRIIGFYADVKQ